MRAVTLTSVSLGDGCGVSCQKDWVARGSRGSGHRALASGSAALAPVKQPWRGKGAASLCSREGESLFGSNKVHCSPQAEMEFELMFYSSCPDSENWSLSHWDVFLCQASPRFSFRGKHTQPVTAVSRTWCLVMAEHMYLSQHNQVMEEQSHDTAAWVSDHVTAA